MWTERGSYAAAGMKSNHLRTQNFSDILRDFFGKHNRSRSEKAFQCKMIRLVRRWDIGRKPLSAGPSGVPKATTLRPNLFGHLADLVMIPLGKNVSWAGTSPMEPWL